MDELKKYPGLLTIVGVLLVLNYLVMPIIDWQDNQAQQLQQKQVQLAKQQAFIAQLDSYQQQLADVERQVTELSQFFYSNQALDGFELEMQTRVAKWLADSGLQNRSMGWQRRVVNEGYTELQLQVSVRGNVPNFQKFQQQIDNQSLRLVFDELRLTVSRASQTRLGNIQGNFKLNFYVLSDATAGGES